MYVKTPKQQFLKSLRTRYPVNIPKRSPLSPFNAPFKQLEFRLVWPAELRDFVKEKSASSSVSKYHMHLILDTQKDFIPFHLAYSSI
jgi:hypothetical protein